MDEPGADGGSPLIPAATVVVLRDGADGLEALLVRRNAALAFAGGHWVFPGGRVDDADRLDDDIEAAARRCAARESVEETGVVLDPGGFVWFAHWTPPPISPKRFSTHFFATRAPDGDLTVTVDGGEIHAWCWMGPAEALARRDAGELELSPPTWITLHTLRPFATAEAALADLAATGPVHYATRISADGPALVALYDGDAGYETSDASVPGARHRLVMADDAWSYVRDL